MLTLLTGLFAGSLHVVTGPDHLTALAPLAFDRPKRALRLGFLWGLGHGLGVVGLGSLGLVAREWIDVHSWSAGAEWLVGLVLIALGLWAIRQAKRVVIHSHDHAHDSPSTHRHVHAHVNVLNHEADHQQRRHTHAVVSVGMLHGAAGSGHVFGVLPALALPSSIATLYLGAYLAGAIASMALFGGLRGVTARRLGSNGLRWLSTGAGVAAIGLGVYWITPWT